MTDAQLRYWWDDVHGSFMEILYRHDPLDMGSTVGSTDDEYFDEATRTIRSLLDLSGEWGLREALVSRWPGAGDGMLDELEAAWRPPAQGRVMMRRFLTADTHTCPISEGSAARVGDT